jgi:hypothetical protein
MNDIQAKDEIDLGADQETQPRELCIVALEHLVPMYFGADKLKPKYDNFNFYALQLRIRIEMAFAMMTRKWGIYWRPLLIGLDKIKYIVEVVGRLHNYCINERIDGGPKHLLIVGPFVDADLEPMGMHMHRAINELGYSAHLHLYNQLSEQLS